MNQQNRFAGIPHESRTRAFGITYAILPKPFPDMHPPAELEALIGQDGIMFSEAIEAEGTLVFAKACELGLEGIASKRLGSPIFERKLAGNR
jgi:hypothetical protein